MQVECGSNFPFPICFTLMEEQAAPRVYIGSLDFGVTQHALRLSMQGLGFEGHIEKIQIIRAGRHSVHRLCSAFVTVGSQEQAQMLARLLRGRYVPTISRHAVDAVVAEPRTGGLSSKKAGAPPKQQLSSATAVPPPWRSMQQPTPPPPKQRKAEQEPEVKGAPLKREPAASAKESRKMAAPVPSFSDYE